MPTTNNERIEFLEAQSEVNQRILRYLDEQMAELNDRRNLYLTVRKAIDVELQGLYK